MAVTHKWQVVRSGIGPGRRPARRALALAIMAAALGLQIVGASASIEVSLTGRVELDHGDNFGSRQSVEYTMLDTGSERVRLDGAAARDLRPGTRITARGRRTGHTLTLSDGSGSITLAGGGSGNTIQANSAATGTASSSALVKRVAVLLVNFVEPTPTPVPPTPTPTEVPPTPTPPPPTPEPTASPSPAPDGTPAPSVDPPPLPEPTPTPAVEATPTLTPTEPPVEPPPTVDPSPSPPPPPTPSPTASPTPPPPPPPPPEPWTKEHVRGVYFTNTRSVASYYSELSAGKMSVTGDVLGYFTLTMTTDSCDYGAWGAAARAAATASGIDLGAYTNVVHAFPKQAACWWMGMANLPGRNSWLNGAMSLYVTSHELGHNFGVHHASTISCKSDGRRVAYSANCSRDEYGDPYDVMGYTGQRHMNSWHRRQLGFLGDADVQTVTAHGTYRVATAELVGGSPRILRVLRPSGDFYYLEFRQPFGRFDNFAATAPPVMGVTIRVAPDLERAPSKLVDTTPDSSSYMDAPLSVGRTFVDPVNQIYITTTSVGPANAEVLIQAGPDSVPPTAPTDLRATTDGSGSIALSWTASTDDAVVTGYTVSRDGVPLETASGTSFAESGLPQGQTYTYRVAAHDRSNVGPETEVQVYLPDTTPPAAPASLSASSSGPNSVTISWTAATDNIAVVAYTVTRDGVQLDTTTATTFADDAVPDGFPSTYEIRAVDAAGNLGVPAIAGVLLPDVSAPQLAGELIAAASAPSSLTLDWQAGSDNVGIAGYRILRDGMLLATVVEPRYVDEGLVQARTYQYAVAAFDAAGNESAALMTTTYVPDVLPPTTPTEVTAAMTTSQTASLAWSAAVDNVGVDHYVVARDGIDVAWTTALTSADLAVVEGSIHSFSVYAVDAAGNVGAAITVDLRAPDVTAPGEVGALSANASSATSVALTWSAAVDNVAVTGYVVSRDGAVVGNLPGYATSFADTALASDRAYRYSVAAVDAAGNAGRPVEATVTLVAVDATPPTTPSNLRAQSLGERRISLTWSASADNWPGTIRYAIFRGTRKIATVTTTSYVDRPATVGKYRYRVRAIDVAGNVSPFSVAVYGRAVR